MDNSDRQNSDRQDQDLSPEQNPTSGAALLDLLVFTTVASSVLALAIGGYVLLA